MNRDDDINRLPAYQAWMERPGKAQAVFDALLSAWREALRALVRASNAVASHDAETARYQRRRAFLATPEGAAMERELTAIHEALQAAERSGNARLAAVYKADADRLHERFALAVSQARRVAA